MRDNPADVLTNVAAVYGYPIARLIGRSYFCTLGADVRLQKLLMEMRLYKNVAGFPSVCATGVADVMDTIQVDADP